MNLARVAALCGIVGLVAATPDAHAKHDPVVGIEWENLEFHVQSKGNIRKLTGGDKKLLCSKVPVSSFGKTFDLLSITYDRMEDSSNHKARLEIATAPIPLCKTHLWEKVQDSISVFLNQSKGRTVEETLENLRNHDPKGQWTYCNDDVENNASEITFDGASGNWRWDTQVNFQVALHQVPLLYDHIQEGTISIAANKEVLVFPLVKAVNGALADAADVTSNEHGFLLLYFLFRALMPQVITGEGQHSEIKNNFGLFPKVHLHELVGEKVRADVIQSFLATNDKTILEAARATNALPDDGYDSLSQDIFQVETVTNPISPFVDRKGRVFIVMESRHPTDSLNEIMKPKNGAKGSSHPFQLRDKAISSLAKLLEPFATPEYDGSSKTCVLL